MQAVDVEEKCIETQRASAGLEQLEATLKHLLREHEINREIAHVRRCMDANSDVAERYLASLIAQWKRHPKLAL